MALGLGLVEVGVPAVAILEQNRAASGWLLALWSLGSLVGGLVASRVTWRRGPAQRWPWLLAGVTVGHRHRGRGLAASGSAGSAFTLFLSGLALAPVAGCRLRSHRRASRSRTPHRRLRVDDDLPAARFRRRSGDRRRPGRHQPHLGVSAGTVVTALAVGLRLLGRGPASGCAGRGLRPRPVRPPRRPRRPTRTPGSGRTTGRTTGRA